MIPALDFAIPIRSTQNILLKILCQSGDIFAKAEMTFQKSILFIDFSNDAIVLSFIIL